MTTTNTVNPLENNITQLEACLRKLTVDDVRNIINYSCPDNDLTPVLTGKHVFDLIEAVIRFSGDERCRLQNEQYLREEEARHQLQRDEAAARMAPHIAAQQASMDEARELLSSHYDVTRIDEAFAFKVGHIPERARAIVTRYEHQLIEESKKTHTGGHFITAIKLIRERTRYGLAEAKFIADTVRNYNLPY